MSEPAKKEIKKENFTYEVEKKNGGEIKVSIKVSSEFFVQEKESVFNRLKAGVSIKGFRPGMAPKNLIEAKLGPSLFEETINRILPKVAIEILEKEKLNPINQLHYHLEKVSEAEGLSYHIEFETIPEFKLPELSKIKVKKDDMKVTKEEIDLVIKDMFDRSQQAKKSEKADKKAEEKMDDKWVTTLEIPSVKTMKELEKEVSEQLKRQKSLSNEEKYKANVLDEIVKKAGISVPKSLLERELANREEDYRKRIEGIGLKFDEFLKSRKTSLEELKKGWEEDAKVRIAREILLVEVAKTNNVTISKEDIEKELSSITDTELKKQYESQNGRNYIATVLIQQKAIDKIMEQVDGKKLGKAAGSDAGRDEKKERVAMTS